jgi:hypothetical protein
MRSPPPPLIICAVLVAAAPAHADPLSDFKAGTSVRIDKATLVLASTGASRTSIGHTIPKTAGSLDFTINANQLGYPVNVPMLVRCTAMPGSKAYCLVDQRFTPIRDVGGGVKVSRISGQLNALASWYPGDVATTRGNVRLAFHDTSFLVAEGTFGIRTVQVKKGTALLGGIIQPTLSTFTTTATVCSSTVEKRHPFTVRLVGPARTVSAPVELESPARGVHLPRIVLVGRNKRETTVYARIDRNFVGTVRLVAAAGGVVRPLAVVVRRREECAP